MSDIFNALEKAIGLNYHIIAKDSESVLFDRKAIKKELPALLEYLLDIIGDDSGTITIKIREGKK